MEWNKNENLWGDATERSSRRRRSVSAAAAETKMICDNNRRAGRREAAWGGAPRCGQHAITRKLIKMQGVAVISSVEKELIIRRRGLQTYYKDAR